MTLLFRQTLPKPFSSAPKPNPKAAKDKGIKLSPGLESEYKRSLIGRISDRFKQRDFNNALKSMFVFKDYIIPNKRADPVFASLIRKSYVYLVLSKVG